MFFIGKKLENMRVFDEKGTAFEATVLQANPVVVTHIKTGEKDGYEAVQISGGKKNTGKIKKPQAGHFGKIKEANPENKRINFLWSKEFKTKDTDKYKLGQIISSVEQLGKGDKVMASAISKGKGFQGVVKRHGFGGGPRSHGQKHSERAPGSIGATGPQRVLKGTKMAGRMGGERVTVKGLSILAVDREKNIILVSGSVPGRRGSLVELRKVNK